MRGGRVSPVRVGTLRRRGVVAADVPTASTGRTIIASGPGAQMANLSERKRGPQMTEGPVLIHIWMVDPAQQAPCVRRLEELFARQITTDPGFVSARILESHDRDSIAAVIEMRSVEDRRRIEQLPEVRDTLDHMHGAANLVIRLFEQVKEYHA